MSQNLEISQRETKNVLHQSVGWRYSANSTSKKKLRRFFASHPLFLEAAAVFAGKLRHSASRAQFLAQFIGAIEMDFTMLTRVVEYDNAVGFEMTGARDLNVTDSMCAH